MKKIVAHALLAAGFMYGANAIAQDFAVFYNDTSHYLRISVKWDTCGDDNDIEIAPHSYHTIDWGTGRCWLDRVEITNLSNNRSYTHSYDREKTVVGMASGSFPAFLRYTIAEKNGEIETSGTIFSGKAWGACLYRLPEYRGQGTLIRSGGC